MKLADQPAVVTGIRDQLGNHRWITGKRFVAVPRIVHTRRIHPGHERGPTGRANRALAIGVCEGNAVGNQCIQRWRQDVRVAEGTDRVKTLLIGAVPENVGVLGHGLTLSFKRPKIKTAMKRLELTAWDMCICSPIGRPARNLVSPSSFVGDVG